jgi:hypothetical protein
LLERQGRLASGAIASYLLFLPFVLWLGVIDYGLIAGIFGLVITIALVARFQARRRSRRNLWALGANILLMMMFSRVASPLVIVPGLACAVMSSMLTFPTMIDRPWLVIGGMAASIVAPIALEWSGVWARTWRIDDGAFVARSTLLALDGVPASVFLITANIAMLVVSGIFAHRLAVSRREATRQLEIQAWHLGQLLPVEAPRRPTATFASC